MAKIIGTAPNQVPTNADLGTMAFQDAAGVNITGGSIITTSNFGVNITPTTVLHVAAETSVPGYAFDNYNADSAGAITYFRKARGTISAPTTVATGERVMSLRPQAYDGTAFRSISDIQSFVETYTTTDNISGGISFFTRPTGVAAANTERMRITASGDVGINQQSPSARLDVNGLIRSRLTDGQQIDLGNSVGLSYISVSANGAACPLVFYTNATEFARFDSTGNFLMKAGGLGYGTGSGGTVTQATSRTTGVTLNKPNGAITLFTAAGTSTPITFTVTNSAVTATDNVVVSVKSSTNVYATFVTAIAAGTFNITFYSLSGTASDTPVLVFSVIKGVTA